MIGGAAPSGFEQQFQEFIFYAGPIIQLVYWLAMIVAAIWAVTLLKRWVDFQVGDADASAAPDPSQRGTDGKKLPPDVSP